jgi:hypothetical protein
MRPLGWQRLFVLWCLNADNPKFPAYFNPEQGTPLYGALRDHLERLFHHSVPSASDEYDSGLQILAAGLMTYGRLDMAEYIIFHLPSERIVTDHSAGRCAVFPYIVLKSILPLPEGASRFASWQSAEWVAGTIQGATRIATERDASPRSVAAYCRLTSTS